MKTSIKKVSTVALPMLVFLSLISFTVHDMKGQVTAKREPEYHPLYGPDPFTEYRKRDGGSCCSARDCIAAQSCLIQEKIGKEKIKYLGWWENGICNKISEEAFIPAPKEACNWVIEKGYDMVVCRRKKMSHLEYSESSQGMKAICAHFCVSS